MPNCCLLLDKAMAASSRRARKANLKVGDDISFAGLATYRITDISDTRVLGVRIGEHGYFVQVVSGARSVSLDLRGRNWARIQEETER